MALTNYLCIGCPLGCHLEVDDDDDRNVLEVRGMACKRGEKFAKQEHTDPRRMMTTTIRISGGMWPKLPVKTIAPLPKDMVVQVCRELHKLQLEAPVAMGDVIMKDALGTGIDIVATRSMVEQAVE